MLILFLAKKNNPFLDLLLNVQGEVGDSELTDQNFREETDTFMFAVHDTTSSSNGFVMIKNFLVTLILKG